MDARADSVRRYLTASPDKPQRPGLMGRAAGLLPTGAVAGSRHLVTAALAPMSQRRFDRLSGTAPVRLHLGCGFEHKDGWVNVDLIGARADIYWDLRRGIPLPDASVDAIFHEHLLEHLPMDVGLAFTEECRRVLAPGGTLRVVVPDAEAAVHTYLSDDHGGRDGAPTRLILLQQLFYEWGHVAMYDAETLTALLLGAGFATARRCEFGQGALERPPDTEARRAESLYVEAYR